MQNALESSLACQQVEERPKTKYTIGSDIILMSMSVIRFEILVIK